ncbi:MAG: glycosyltransferase, partial [Candidatus Aenigmarchaeota archaeon]|nr:glycosyltransferase [Candidatus Aenigmarchaeota archaeon]
MPRSPLVSIVTAAYNEERHIGKFLNSIKGLDYPKNRLETIIVDDGSI